MILYMQRMVMDMPINNQAEQNCFICEKHKG
ncbi:UNVERIFIED_CONTAM: HIT family protein, partial [Bacillus mycoides]